MKKIFLLVFVLAFPLILTSQINCTPTLGFGFTPIKKNILLYKEPNLNSQVVLKSQEPDNVRLICTNTNIINDFVEVEVDFLFGAFKENGVNDYLYRLYQYLTDEYEYTFDFKSFMEFIFVQENQIKIYDLLINDKTNDWFKDYSFSAEYDVSTFEGFYQNWIYYDRPNSNENYIINNQNRKVYVHKNDITNKGGIVPLIVNANSDFYFDFFKNELEFKKQNSCIFDEDSLIRYFQFYANALISEKNYFEVIQEINKYNDKFTGSINKYKIDFLKTKACYYDQNYSLAAKIAEELVYAFDYKKISNSNNTFSYGDIDMSMVYAFLISGLQKTEKYAEALKYSKICELDVSLQFPQHTEFYVISLLKLDQKIKACEILNKAYLNGNESARELLKKYCK